MAHHLNDQILVFRIKRGDTGAFASLYDYYVERIYRFVFLKVPTIQDAEDITAEAFLKLWHAIREGKPIENLQALLYQIARNGVADFYRKRGVPTEAIEDAEMIVADRTDLTLEEKMALKSDMVAVESAIRQLKDAYREVVTLHFLNELSLREIAKIVEKKPGTVRVLLHRGLKILREIVTETKR